MAVLPIDEHAALSPRQFETTYRAAHKPVILRGAIAHWPAVSRWSSAYLKDVAADLQVRVKSKTDYADGASKRHIESSRDACLGTVIDLIDAEHTPDVSYVRQTKAWSTHPRLRADVGDLRYGPPSLPITAGNLWIGPKDTVAQLHWDPAHNLFAQIRGEKKWILVGPAESGRTYPNRFSVRAALADPRLAAAAPALADKLRRLSRIDKPLERFVAEDLDDQDEQALFTMLAAVNNCDVNAEAPDPRGDAALHTRRALRRRAGAGRSHVRPVLLAASRAIAQRQRVDELVLPRARRRDRVRRRPARHHPRAPHGMTPAMSGLPARVPVIAHTLDPLRRVAPHLDVRLDPSMREGDDGWCTPAALIRDEARGLAALLDCARAVEGCDDRHLLALTAANVCTMPLIAAAVGPCLAAARLPDLDPAHVLVRFDPGTLRGGLCLLSTRYVALADDPVARDDGEAELVGEMRLLRDRCRRAIEVYAAPLVDALHGRTGIGRRALWSSIADNIADVVIVATKALGRVSTCEAELRGLIHIAGSPLASTSAKGVTGVSWIEQDGRREPFVKRGACCLQYRRPDHEYCANCPVPAGRGTHRASACRGRTPRAMNGQVERAGANGLTSPRAGQCGSACACSSILRRRLSGRMSVQTSWM